MQLSTLACIKNSTSWFTFELSTQFSLIRFFFFHIINLSLLGQPQSFFCLRHSDVFSVCFCLFVHLMPQTQTSSTRIVWMRSCFNDHHFSIDKVKERVQCVHCTHYTHYTQYTYWRSERELNCAQCIEWAPILIVCINNTNNKSIWFVLRKQKVEQKPTDRMK